MSENKNNPNEFNNNENNSGFLSDGEISRLNSEELSLMDNANTDEPLEEILQAPVESAFNAEDLALFRAIREEARKNAKEEPEAPVEAINEEDKTLINTFSVKEELTEEDPNNFGETIVVASSGTEGSQDGADVEKAQTIKIDSPEEEKKNRKRGKKGPKRPWWQSILLGIWSVIKVIFWYVCIAAGAVAVGLLIFSLCIDQFEDPDLDALFANRQLAQTTEIYAKDPETDEYELVKEVYLDENREWINIEDMPKCLIDALVSIEDERFWKHNGVDWKRTTGAIIKYIAGVDDYGGSTITQQLIKNITGEDDYAWQRKAKEILRALYIEKKYDDKNIILEYYLNTVYFNYRAYGVGVASEMYFGKHVSELNAAEAASLVAIVQKPAVYEPYYNPDNNAERKELVLEKMLELGYLTQEEFDYYIDYHISFNPKGMEMQYETDNSYYIDQVINDVIRDISEQMEITPEAAEIYFYSAGLKVYSCLDQQVQDVLDHYFIEDQSWWPEGYIDEDYQAALYIMNPFTGEVMGMAGGRGEKTNRGLNRATQSPRQTGSAVKPLSVYAPGIEEGVLNLGSIVDDIPLTFNGNVPYPQNVSRTFNGLTTMYDAIRYSLNATPAQILQDLTYDTAYEYLTDRLHFEHLVEEDIGVAAMAMGGMTYGATVAEMTAGYAAIANKGVYTEPITYTRVEEANGKVLIENTPETNQAFSEETAWLMQELLVDGVHNGFAALDLKDIPLAGKTGTTDSGVDKWYMCYSPYFAAGIWVGYDENNISLDDAGVMATVSRYAFKYVMDEVVEVKGWDGGSLSEKPDTIVSGEYCLDCGGTPTENCEKDVRGDRIASTYFVKDQEPPKCTCHTLVYICKSSGMVAHNGCPKAEQKALVLTNRRLPMKIGLQDAYYMWMNIPDGVPVSDEGVAFQNVLGPGNSVGKGDGKKVNHLCTDHSIPTGKQPELYNPNTAVKPTYKLTAVANANATFSFGNSVKIKVGNDYTFKVTAKEGFLISSLTANGATLAPDRGNDKVNTYTVKDVYEEYTVEVILKEDPNYVPPVVETPSEPESSEPESSAPEISEPELPSLDPNDPNYIPPTTPPPPGLL